jgi:hypothetical protein
VSSPLAPERNERIDTGRRKLVLAVGAAVMYGSWAFVANVSRGGGAWRAAVAQAILSFVSTMTISIVMEAAYGRSGTPKARAIRAAAAGCATTCVMTTAVHLAVGTPNLVVTVVPVLVIGSTYCVLYSIGLLRLDRRLRYAV